jgi:betR domain|nr:MAG TPA: Transcriptional repressor, TetR family Alpha Protein, Transcriptional Repressor [Caudoviricetes sp.]DAM32200.1 MAG TPA: Transcriptional repressor, TetR family Alpha Protein, Transcriptional Repressor [Caudoviricetes sp.]DAY00483.1 MAG TPA: Transcriptional repressor, TetR family Alpha Protein, Transcriptional Repressor [Caudoviricetes sp.]
MWYINFRKLRKRKKEMRWYEMNRNLLEAKLKEKGSNVAEISKIIGVEPSTFYRKLSGQSDFFRKEIEKIVKYLNLSIDEMEKIFFGL